MRNRRAPLAVAVAFGALVLAACGQYEGIRRPEPGPSGPSSSSSAGGMVLGERVSLVSFDTVASISTSPPGGSTSTQAAGGAPSQEAAPSADLEGPLYTCPVRGRGYYLANFGAYRPGPPVHAHQGNDVFAPHDTPIVAPFDGYAVATPNTLGGKAVKVYGPDGYVYNAHLSRYGRLGEVHLGEVVGFVGATGNAATSAPHDHFEWHPGNGAAVDPFPFLNEACPPVAEGGGST